MQWPGTYGLLFYLFCCVVVLSVCLCDLKGVRDGLEFPVLAARLVGSATHGLPLVVASRGQPFFLALLVIDYGAVVATLYIPGDCRLGLGLGGRSSRTPTLPRPECLHALSRRVSYLNE